MARDKKSKDQAQPKPPPPPPSQTDHSLITYIEERQD